MKVLVLGGYGVFGVRLAELLVRDGHDVVIAGRNAHQAEAAAARLGCQCLVLDHRMDPARIFSVGPQVVVDAAGPFQAYGDDPYRIPRLCLAHVVDYLDLSDDASFTQGLVALDAQARLAGRRLLSGASSVPGISSAVAADLCAGLDEVLLIDTAILPGNRAPRGASVIASIVGQMGTDFAVFRGGLWRRQATWSDHQQVRLAPGLVRTAYAIEVPDQRLFPAFFGARSVVFRAGMELGVLNTALRVMARLRRRWPFAVTPGRAEWIRRMANLLLPLGTDRGGMQVQVVGRQGAEVVQRVWQLVAESGHGPYIPAVMARAVIRVLHQVPPGARACLAEVSRGAVEAALADLAVSVQTQASTRPVMMREALGELWHQLPRPHQALHQVHDVESFVGEAQVTRGRGGLARCLAACLRFPSAAERVAVRVTKTRIAGGEVWERDFAGKVFRSTLSPAPQAGCCLERFGPFCFELELPVDAAGLHLQVRRGWFLGLPLPRSWLPRSDSREHVLNHRFHFDVALTGPWGIGLIVRYRGWLVGEGAAEQLSTPSNGID